MVYLITGKKGAGKTHYARTFAEELELEGFRVKIVDGDELRAQTQNLDFTREGRERNLMEAARIAKIWEQKGYVVLVAMVAPYQDIRERMRHQWHQSRVIYLPGGTLWEGSEYQRPDEFELLN